VSKDWQMASGNALNVIKNLQEIVILFNNQ
jgi:hypothetical protein